MFWSEGGNGVQWCCESAGSSEWCCAPAGRMLEAGRGWHSLSEVIEGERSVVTVMEAPPSVLLQRVKAMALICVQFYLVGWRELQAHYARDHQPVSWGGGGRRECEDGYYVAGGLTEEIL